MPTGKAKPRAAGSSSLVKFPLICVGFAASLSAVAALAGSSQPRASLCTCARIRSYAAFVTALPWQVYPWSAGVQELLQS